MFTSFQRQLHHGKFVELGFAFDSVIFYAVVTVDRGESDVIRRDVYFDLHKVSVNSV